MISTQHVIDPHTPLRHCDYCGKQAVLLTENIMRGSTVATYAYVECLWCHARGPRFCFDIDGQSAPARALRSWMEHTA
jgi:hypothetical protein